MFSLAPKFSSLCPCIAKMDRRLEDGGKTEGRFFCVLFSTKEPSPCVPKEPSPCVLHLFLQRQSIPLPAHGRVIGNDMLVLLFHIQKHICQSFFRLADTFSRFSLRVFVNTKGSFPCCKKASSLVPPLAQNTDTFQPVSALVSTPDVPRR